MKKTFILILVMVSCFTFSCKKDKKTTPPLGYFRKTTWGLDSVSVKGSEVNKQTSSFDTTVVGSGHTFKFMFYVGDELNNTINYVLVDNVLRAGEIFYDFNGLNYTGDQFIAANNTLKGKLNNLYGQPVDQTKWYVTTFQNNSSQWGTALTNGDVEFISFWSLTKSYIYLDMFNSNNFIFISNDFYDNSFYAPQKSAELTTIQSILRTKVRQFYKK